MEFFLFVIARATECIYVRRNEWFFLLPHTFGTYKISGQKHEITPRDLWALVIDVLFVLHAKMWFEFHETKQIRFYLLMEFVFSLRPQKTQFNSAMHYKCLPKKDRLLIENIQNYTVTTFDFDREEKEFVEEQNQFRRYCLWYRKWWYVNGGECSPDRPSCIRRE